MLWGLSSVALKTSHPPHTRGCKGRGCYVSPVQSLTGASQLLETSPPNPLARSGWNARGTCPRVRPKHRGRHAHQRGCRGRRWVPAALPRARGAGRPCGTIFSQGERAAPDWYAALGIPAGRSPRLPFLGCLPPRALCPPRPGREHRPGLARPGNLGAGPRGERGLQPGQGPTPSLHCLLWPVCACVWQREKRDWESLRTKKMILVSKPKNLNTHKSEMHASERVCKSSWNIHTMKKYTWSSIAF